MENLFITVEGMDGSGKTTQIQKLTEYFETKGFKVFVSREPGGTVIGEAIRDILLNIEYQEMDYMTEALLYAASRSQHVAEKIIPALEKGYIVLCDRFVDSSLVYQGMSRGLGIDAVAQINKFATRGLVPNLTFFLDLDHESGMSRKRNQQVLDRLEAEKAAFHEKVRKGYLHLQEEYPDRIFSVDASRSIEEVHDRMVQVIEKYFDK